MGIKANKEYFRAHALDQGRIKPKTLQGPKE